MRPSVGWVHAPSRKAKSPGSLSYTEPGRGPPIPGEIEHTALGRLP
jgi:hypothetical protein